MTEYKPDEGMDIVFSEDTDQAPKIHRDKDHNNHKYQCVLCSSTLPMPYMLLRHLESVHLAQVEV
jgi:hypothetical protein